MLTALPPIRLALHARPSAPLSSRAMTDEPGTELARLPSQRATVVDAPLVALAVVTEGPDLGRRFDLRGRPLRLGKSLDCDVTLTDGSISKHHLELQLVGSAVRLRDLGSTNGVFVGETRVIESLVPLGTVLQLGRTKLHLRGEDEGLVIEPSTAASFGGLAGRSIAMRQLYAVLERVAARDVTVLLDGATGTGKELAARALHDASPRRAAPFVVFDCSAAVPELVESQLFGHVRGAFTGAAGDRAGVFESAAGGTVFLDELDSLPLTLQPKLLRVLEGRCVVRLGEFRERPVNVRVVAASGGSPEEAIARGELRRDLYFRLAVVRVTLPELRHRLDDLGLLARVLLDRLGGGDIAVEDGPALDRLRRHTWPGNVRELRNVLERAWALAPVGAGRLDDLPIQLGGLLGRPPADRIELHAELPYKDAKARVVAGWERAYLEAAWSRCGGNLSATARQVGLSRPHLRKLLREHGLVEGGGSDVQG